MELDSKASNYQQLVASFRWPTPTHFNIAQACCGRWAEDRSRLALYYEDPDGRTQAWSFWDIQRAANRLSNVFGALGTLRGERIAIILPQRPEAAIAHIACYQMGAISVPLSPQDASVRLESRLRHAGARIAVVAGTVLPELLAIRENLPNLRQIIVVGACLPMGNGVHDWTRLLEYASPRYSSLATTADAPALIDFVDDTATCTRGILLRQRALLGGLPGFVCAQDFYPRPGDMFWSCADWSSSTGLFSALLSAWHFGQPVLCYQGHPDAEKTYRLIIKYAVRNLLLGERELPLMMQAVPTPREKYGADLNLRSLAVGDAAISAPLMAWAKEQLGVLVNTIFGQPGFQAILGGCTSVYPAKPGSIGRAYPGYRIAILDGRGSPVPTRDVGEICLQYCGDGEYDPQSRLEFWSGSEATPGQSFEMGGTSWDRTGILASCDEEGYFWLQEGRRRITPQSQDEHFNP